LGGFLQSSGRELGAQGGLDLFLHQRIVQRGMLAADPPVSDRVCLVGREVDGRIELLMDFLGRQAHRGQGKKKRQFLHGLNSITMESPWERRPSSPARLIRY